MLARAARPLTDAERLDWLRLIRSENVGPVSFYHLLRFYGSAEAALDALPALARRGGRKRPVKICPAARAEKEFAAAARAGARMVAAIEPEYPEALAAVEDAPPVVSIKGDASILGRPCLGIVGARNASSNGRRLARTLATELGQAGFTIVSGLARGIDTAAHTGSLASGTVAVVAGGVDICYPPENKALLDDIGTNGAVIAEQPPGTEPQGRHFPRRNRLISGLSRGVIVVEAAPRSGSLITARMALEQGREVFAVPGSPLDPRCRGTNNLIREGATLTEGAEDVLRALAGSLDRQLAEPPTDPEFGDPGPGAAIGGETDTARSSVLSVLSPSPTGVDELIRGCQLRASAVAAVLLELELAGRLERLPGNRVALLAD